MEKSFGFTPGIELKGSKKADRLRQNLRPLSWDRKIPQRQADVRIFFKEGAWLTNPLPRSAT